MTSIARKVWLITGGAGALGSELVLACLRLGDDCIALDCDQKRLNALHLRCMDLGLPAPALYPLDLIGATSDDYEDLAERISDEFGRLDRLVHAAARLSALRPLVHQDAKEWLHGLQLGLTGPLWLTRALLPLMAASASTGERGHVLWVGDQAVLDQPAHWGIYGLAQAGNRWMVDALRAEWGPRAPQVSWLDSGPFFSALRTAGWPAQSADEVPSAAQAAEALLRGIERMTNTVGGRHD